MIIVLTDSLANSTTKHSHTSSFVVQIIPSRSFRNKRGSECPNRNPLSSLSRRSTANTSSGVNFLTLFSVSMMRDFLEIVCRGILPGSFSFLYLTRCILGDILIDLNDNPHHLFIMSHISEVPVLPADSSNIQSVESWMQTAQKQRTECVICKKKKSNCYIIAITINPARACSVCKPCWKILTEGNYQSDFCCFCHGVVKDSKQILRLEYPMAPLDTVSIMDCCGTMCVAGCLNFLKEKRRICMHCASTEPLYPAYQTCGGCRKVYYCSGKCQREDWSTHKQYCKNLKEI